MTGTLAECLPTPDPETVRALLALVAPASDAGGDGVDVA